MTGWR
jgi:hypothetical protein